MNLTNLKHVDQIENKLQSQRKREQFIEIEHEIIKTQFYENRIPNQIKRQIKKKKEKESEKVI